MPVTVSLADQVGIVEFSRPPHNFFDMPMLEEILAAYRYLGSTSDCRCIVLCSDGNHFCAGANFRTPGSATQALVDAAPQRHLYDVAAELFVEDLPVIAAVQGAAVGGGLGLALSADFRVMTAKTRLSANFSHIGFHQGFAISATLPRLVGQQRAMDMLYNSRDVFGEAALDAGLCDRLADPDLLRQVAMDMAHELALAAPLALREIRRTMRRELVSEIKEVMRIERSAQEGLRQTEDFRAGVTAARGTLPPFTGR